MTAESGLLIAPGTRLVNAFNKETFIFHDPREGLPSAEFQVLLEAGGSGGGNAVAHIHPGIGRALHGAYRRSEGDDRWRAGDSKS